MDRDLSQLVWLALLWGLYGVLHSVLATHWLKAWVGRRWPALLPAYRLGFNVLAVLLFLPPYLLMKAWDGPLLWQWEGAERWLVNGIAVAALLAFLHTLLEYDLATFAGTRQWRERARHAVPLLAEPDRLRLGWQHRHVRHPWYFLALLLIWTQPMDAAFLLSALVWTVYLLIGLRFEEQKLVRQFGEAYRRYQQRVPALLPRPWRRLGAAEALELEALAQQAEEAE